MEAILILLIIFIQFAIVYFSVQKLTEIELKLASYTQAIDKFNQKIEPAFKQTNLILQKINKGFEKLYKHKNKLKMYRNLMLVKSILVTIILYKKRKNILNFFSVYGIINKFTKALMEI